MIILILLFLGGVLYFYKIIYAFKSLASQRLMANINNNGIEKKLLLYLTNADSFGR